MSHISDRIDLIFKQWDSTASPGCMLAVIKNGKFVYKRGYGMADLERGVAISSESIFDIGSTGKQFAAMVIVMLANRGKLGLDDPIRRYVPETHTCLEDIRIRHLLHHTSGLRDYLTLLDLRGLPMENIYAEEFLLDLIARQKGLNFKPGSEFLYSNSGYFLLGIIAQRVTGKHITALIKEFILDPLGMKSTTFNKDHRPIVKHRAASYEEGEEAGTFVNAVALSGGFGDGALLSNIDDLLLWDDNFYYNKLNDSQPDLIGQMHTTGSLNNGKPITYAFGLDVTKYKGRRVVKHAGGWAGYRSELMRFPEQHMSVICLCNLGSMDPTALCEQVADVIFEDSSTQEISKQKQKDKSSSAPQGIHLEEFTGVYQGKLLTYDMFIRDGELYLSSGRQDYQLAPFGKKKFQLNELPITLIYSGDGNANLTMKKGNETSRLKRVRSERYKPSSCAPYVGNYRSAELDCNYIISEKEDGLEFKRHPFDAGQALHIFSENALRTSLGELRLRFSRDGKIIGFILNAGRVKNIRFRKT